MRAPLLSPPGTRAAVPVGVVLALVAALAAGTASAAVRGPSRPAPVPAQLGLRGEQLRLPAGPPAARPASPPRTRRRRTPAAPAVAPLRHTHAPDLMVSSAAPLPAAVPGEIARLPGVVAVQAGDFGTVRIDHRPANLMGVDPSGFRGWTPLLTARSDPLWRAVAAGEGAVSFDMAHNVGLPLGGTVAFTGRRSYPVRLGAFASVGIAGVDAIVSDARAVALGLPHDNALLVSAPRADPVALRSLISRLLPAGDRVQLLAQVVVVRDAGEYLTRAQIAGVLKAAASRIGSPYLWGGTGPHVFDCSGLVGWSFGQAGISLPRTAAQQFLAGPHVPYADARPGDLLFWTYDPTAPDFVDHVALYAGHGMMLVAAHTGTVVSYQPVPLAHLAGVVRVDPAMAEQVGGPRFP